jgi:creatinine amidohydrolase
MRFYEMTAPELRQAPRETTVVIAPIAACEQHSRHLPVYTDTLLVTAVADGVEQRLAKQVLLLPTLWLGASDHHLPWGGTLSVNTEMHIQLLCGLVSPLLDDGYKRLLILNGHGGNIDTMQSALRLLQPRYPDRLLTAASYWDLASKELAEIASGPRKQMGHACEFETSMIMALRPELVRQDQIKDDVEAADPALRGLFICQDFKQRTDHGCVGHPELATPEKGRKCLEVSIRRTAEVAETLSKRPLPRKQ